MKDKETPEMVVIPEEDYDMMCEDMDYNINFIAALSEYADDLGGDVEEFEREFLRKRYSPEDSEIN